MRLTLEVELTGPGALLRGLAGGGVLLEAAPQCPTNHQP